VHTPILLATHITSIGQYWHKITDPTFRGIYHVNAFDLAMMIPYFLVLFVLATYGLHRYWLVYDYYKYRRNIPGPPPQTTRWPRVTVQLPIFNERYVIERLVEAVSRFNYPHELLDIQVLDDSTDETEQVASACVARFLLPTSFGAAFLTSRTRRSEWCRRAGPI
jgi:cellulose synthase/poly-beta-1,6-N-acetylglucosamine synthase-like glycosyltransferase